MKQKTSDFCSPLSGLRPIAGLVLILLLCFCASSAAAQEEPAVIQPVYQPITDISLGVEHLELEVGDTYAFRISYQPETPAFTSLNWFTTDDSVIEIDPVKNIVTAKKAGRARIFAESLDGVSFDTCDVAVMGKHPKDAAETISGKALISLSAADRAKITAEPLNRYIDFIESAGFTSKALEKAGERVFSVTADVKPGTEEEESKRAYALGMTDAEPLLNLHAVTLQGTLSQILAFVKENDSLSAVFGGELRFITDPAGVPFENEYITPAGAEKLDGHVEELTSVSTAHKLGYKGNGTIIAVIDTGLDPDHPQFAGRVIGQRCFSSSYESGTNTYRGVCDSITSAKPFNAITKSEFWHGSHVTGIAAGTDGIAPKAKIVAVQAFTEKTWECSSSELYFYGCTGSGDMCCKSVMVGNDEYKAYDYLLELAKKGKKIAAVNMSYGGLSFDSSCDDIDPYTYGYYSDLVKAGIIPVTSAGNSGDNTYLSLPACFTNTYAVGGLADAAEIKLAYYSNWGEMADIAAPGTEIISARYPSGYTRMSGTSMAAPVVTGAMAILKQAMPGKTVSEYEQLLKDMSPKSVSERRSLWGGDKPLDITRKIVNFSRMIGGVTPEITRSSGHSLTVRFKEVENAGGYTITVLDIESGKNIKAKQSREKKGDYWVYTLTGLGNGKPYSVTVTPYRRIGSSKLQGKSGSVTGIPNPMLKGFTVTPGNQSAGFRLIPYGSSFMSGMTYNVYRASDGEKVWTKTITQKPWGQTAAGLTNGTLYYATVTAFKNYNGTRYNGLTSSKIYFVPLSKPLNAKVTFSGNTAKISISSDSAASGISVMYRPAGGAVEKGCESTGFTCRVTGLNRNRAYEFYVMKYKTISGKKHYGPGALAPYKTAESGLNAPGKPLIRMQPGNKYLFAVNTTTGVEGFAVLYRVGEGQFKKACEGKRSTAYNDLRCTTDFTIDTSKNYTFYIMQYKTVKGKKLYSPGISVNNWLAPK